MIDSISVENFTAFDTLDLKFSKGINVFIGANSTGKSHLLKLLYVFCSANKPVRAMNDPASDITKKMNNVFKPEDKIGRLCRNEAEKTKIHVKLNPDIEVSIVFSSDMDEAIVKEEKIGVYGFYEPVPVFIPPKEMLSLFEGFSSLYLKRELTIDETYFDLSQALGTPKLKDEPSEPVSLLLEKIKTTCDGEFLFMKKKKFYYKPTKGRILEVELAAEGYRKLGMLQQLLQNGQLDPEVSGPLFWDEPESNLNPSIIKQLVDILLELSRNGQQIFLATHDYIILKWLDLMGKSEDPILFHSFYKNNEGEIEVNSTSNYLDIRPNAIDDTFAELIDKDIESSMGDLGK